MVSECHRIILSHTWQQDTCFTGSDKTFMLSNGLAQAYFSSIPDVYCTSLPTEVAGAALMTIYCICSAYLLLCVVLCRKDACIIMTFSFDEREMKTKTSASDQRLACG